MIVLEWAEIVQVSRNQLSLPWIATTWTTMALKSDRCALIALLRPGIRQQGDTTWAWDSEQREAEVHQWSRKTGIGKKFTLSSCFTVTPQRPALQDTIYDHYRAVFSGCDAFNQQMHNRTFLYALLWDVKLFLATSGIYLFTSTLLNCWNAWRSVLQSHNAECQLPSYVDFSWT